MHRRCSSEAMHRRWGRPVLAERDYHRLLHAAQCFLTRDGAGEAVALTCLGPVPGEAGCADLGLQVADASQGLGIGTALAWHAASHARTAGWHTLTAYTQATNTALLGVLRALGPVAENRDGPCVEVRLPLNALTRPPRLREVGWSP
nr:GNAT family N-acetyltransferase [Streptomyces sp. YIM 98790]